MAEDTARKYKLLRYDTGFYRVYYKNVDTGRLLCVQNSGSRGADKLEFFVCSSDGEPSHQISWPTEIDADDFSSIRFPT